MANCNNFIKKFSISCEWLTMNWDGVIMKWMIIDFLILNHFQLNLSFYNELLNSLILINSFGDPIIIFGSSRYQRL